MATFPASLAKMASRFKDATYEDADAMALKKAAETFTRERVQLQTARIRAFCPKIQKNCKRLRSC